MITGEEWKDQDESKVHLDFALSKRYAEAGTVFLFQAADAILAAQVKKVSPNGKYIYIGPEGSQGGAWVPAEKIEVLDVLVPMQEQQQAIPMPSATELIEALAKCGGQPQPRKPRKGKDKQ